LTEDGGPDISQPFKSEAVLGGPPKKSVQPRGREKRGDLVKKNDKSKDNEKKKEKPTDPEKKKEKPTDPEKKREKPTDPEKKREKPTDPEKKREKPTDPEKKREKPSVDPGKKRENPRNPEKETPREPDQKRDEGNKKREKDGGTARVRPAPDPDWPALRKAVNSIRCLLEIIIVRGFFWLLPVDSYRQALLLTHTQRRNTTREVSKRITDCSG
jgi:outer membrane biosynthesis protein TonB